MLPSPVPGTPKHFPFLQPPSLPGCARLFVTWSLMILTLDGLLGSCIPPRVLHIRSCLWGHRIGFFLAQGPFSRWVVVRPPVQHVRLAFSSVVILAPPIFLLLYVYGPPPSVDPPNNTQIQFSINKLFISTLFFFFQLLDLPPQRFINFLQYFPSLLARWGFFIKSWVAFFFWPQLPNFDSVLVFSPRFFFNYAHFLPSLMPHPVLHTQAVLSHNIF